MELELIVADYFSMLSRELSGEKYNKSEYLKKLLPFLSRRSDGSIEFKHQNISAALIHLGLPYIKGYAPRFNYHKILADHVLEYLDNHPSIENQFKRYSESDISPSRQNISYEKLVVDPPAKAMYTLEPPVSYRSKNPIKINYLEKELRNCNLGKLGEQYVLEYEKWRLNMAGKENLAENVRWISQEEGDGAGFDILSSNTNGTDKYIEVKTTRLGKETPFFFSRNELFFPQTNSENYHLYRLFDVEQNARMFIKDGRLDRICHMVPLTFKGYF